MIFGRFNNVAKSMVNELLEGEEENQIQEAITTTVSVKMDVSSASMLTVLSELFGQSRYAFTGDILEGFAVDLFFNLPESKRVELAIKADKLTTEQFAKQGISTEVVGPSGTYKGDHTWRELNTSPSLIAAYSSDNTKEVA